MKTTTLAPKNGRAKQANEWQAHEVRQLTGKVGVVRFPAKLQIVTERWNRVAAVPYIVYMPEKDRLLMLVSCDYPHHAEVLFSDDRGLTWSDPKPAISGKDGRPLPALGTGLCYLGAGSILFYAGSRWFSRDYTALARRDDSAELVIRKVHKKGKGGRAAAGVEADPIRGRYPNPVGDKALVLEYEPDSELRDTEQVPLLEDGGIKAFIRREVSPHAPDAWFDESSVKVGYEISFNRYFYKPEPLRSLEEIRTDILALEKETEGLLGEIVGEGVGK